MSSKTNILQLERNYTRRVFWTLSLIFVFWYMLLWRFTIKLIAPGKSEWKLSCPFCYNCVPFLTKAEVWAYGASLVAQWLRICLPIQGTRVRALVWEDPTCRGATGPVSHSYWAWASGACAPQQERPRQWEACAPRWRVAPTRRNWRKPSHRNEDPTQPKINIINK